MKSKRTYILLCVLGGYLGLHKYYIEEYGKGVIYTLTVGLLFFGWLRDLMHMPGDIDRYNATRGYVSLRQSKG